MDGQDTIETVVATEHTSEVTDDGVIIERTITREIEQVDDSEQVLERIMDLEARLSKIEQGGRGSGVMQPTATETVIETPPPEKKDEPKAPEKGAAEAKTASGAPSSGPEAKPKKRRPGFWF